VSGTNGWQLSFQSEGFHDYLRSALSAVDEIPFRDLGRKTSVSVLADFFPRRSKSLTSNVGKSLFSIDDPLLLVITVHLYFDHILLLACGRSGLSRRTEESTFANRLSELERRGQVPSKLALALRVVNRLRNCLAHDLLFDLANWDPRAFAFIGTGCKRVPKHRFPRREKHLLLFRIAALHLLHDLHRHWRWLYVEDLTERGAARTGRQSDLRQAVHGQLSYLFGSDRARQKLGRAYPRPSAAIAVRPAA